MKAMPRLGHFVASPIIAVCLAVVGLLTFSAPVEAWDVAKSTNGVVLVRESTDSTASSSVRVYYGYKGGGLSHTLASSYTDYREYVGVLGGAVDAYEVELEPGYDRQLVYTVLSGRVVAVRYEPLRVTVENTRTVPVSLSSTASLSATVTNFPEASTTMTVEGTLPVDVVGVFSDPTIPEGMMVLVTTASVFAGFFGFRAMRGNDAPLV